MDAHQLAFFSAQPLSLLIKSETTHQQIIQQSKNEALCHFLFIPGLIQ